MQGVQGSGLGFSLGARRRTGGRRGCGVVLRGGRGRRQGSREGRGGRGVWAPGGPAAGGSSGSLGADFSGLGAEL